MWKPQSAMANIPSFRIRTEVLRDAAFPIEYRFWQPEQLLSDASRLIEKCLELKIKVDDLWVEWAREEVEALKDKQAQEISDDEGFVVDRWPEHMAIVEKETLEKPPGSLFYTGYGLAPNLGGVLANIVAHGQLLSANNNGVAAAPGGIAQGNAILSAYQFGAQLAVLDERVKFEKIGTSRRAKIRAQAAELRKERAKYRADNHPLDFESRCTSINNIISRSLADVEKKCTVAEKGLQDIYGLGLLGLPSLPPLPTLTSTVEEFYLYIQQRTLFLAQFGALDQGFTTCVELEGEIGAPIRFGFDDELFSRHSHCRLRGISAFVEGDDPSNIYRAVISVPSRAIYRIGPVGALRKASSAELKDLLIDQSSMPACVLGRVSSRSATRPPEIGGAVSLFNASPISDPSDGKDEQWSIQVDSLLKSKASHVRSIQIELTLVGRPISALQS